MRAAIILTSTLFLLVGCGRGGAGLFRALAATAIVAAHVAHAATHSRAVEAAPVYGPVTSNAINTRCGLLPQQPGHAVTLSEHRPDVRQPYFCLDHCAYHEEPDAPPPVY